MFAHLCTIFKQSIEMYDLFNFKFPDLQIAILKIDSIDPEATVVFPEEYSDVQARSNPKRKNEYLGVRYLRNQLDISSPILYHRNGRPYFSAVEKALSISHSKDYVALALAAFPIGVDIEQRDRDAARIINKFAVEDEKILCTHDPNQWYLQLWCAKEAIYKLVGIENLSFKNEIRIRSRRQKEHSTFLSATVDQATQKHEIEVQLHETTVLHIAIAYFKVAL